MLIVNRDQIIAVLAYVLGIIALVLPSRFKNILISADFDIGDIIIVLMSVILVFYARRSFSLSGIILVALAIGTLAISSYFSTESHLSAMLKYVVFFLVLALSPIRLIINQTHIKFVMIFIFIYSVIAILSSLFHAQFQSIFGWSDTAYGLASGSLRRARGLTGGPIITAEIMVMFMVLIAAIRSKFSNVSIIVLSSTTYIGVLLTFSRIALIIATLIYIFIIVKSSLGGAVKFGMFILMSIMSIIALLVISPKILPESDLINRFNLSSFSLDVNAENQDLERVETLQNVSSLIKSEPLFGYGPRSLFIYKNLQSNQDTQNTIFVGGRLYLVEPHSIFLLWAQEIGIIGASIVLMYLLNLTRSITKYSSLCIAVVLLFSLTSSDLFISLPVEVVMVVTIILINSIKDNRHV